MKVYLVNPPFVPGYCRSVRGVGESSRGGTLYYPIWLSYCAAILNESHKIKLIDTQAQKWTINELINDIISFRPDIVVIDTNFSSLHQDVITAEKIKNIFPTIIILVGPPISQYAEIIITNPSIDFVIPYEYDFTLRDLISAIEKQSDLSKVHGIVYKNEDRIIFTEKRAFSTSKDLDSIPFVSMMYKKFLNINDYFLSSSLYPMVQIFTGRGCPNQCTFCSWPITLMGKKYRTRCISNVVDELEWIQNNLPVKEVFFEDDTFTLKKERVMEFCKEYRKRGLTIVWACNARVNTTDLETMREMKRANCRLLIVGYESGDDGILQNIKKGITTDQSRIFAKNAKIADLLVHGDFIIGLPGETKETIRITKEFIDEVRPELLQVLVPQPVPGTELYKYYDEKNLLLEKNPQNFLDSSGYQISVVAQPQLSGVDINYIADSILKNYYFSPKYVPLVLRQIVRKNGILELRRLLYSFKMFKIFVEDSKEDIERG